MYDYEFAKGSRWKPHRLITLEELYQKEKPDAIMFSTLNYCCCDRSDTTNFDTESIFPGLYLEFDRMHINTADGHIHLITDRPRNEQVSFHSINEIHTRSDISGDIVVRIRCKTRTVQKTFYFVMLKGEIYQ